MFNEIVGAVRRHRHTLLTKQNVVGCGLGYKHISGRATTTLALVVFVTQKYPLTALSKPDHVPRRLDQVTTDVIAVGYIRPLDIRTVCWRPAVPGVSIGHYKISAGTLGAIVYDNDTGRALILSNNHVLANASGGDDKRARIGDAIWQPGPYDGGTKDDTIAHLHRYEALQFTAVPDSPVLAAASGTRAAPATPSVPAATSPPANMIDAALALPVGPGLVDPTVLGLGSVIGTARVQPGDTVWKSGRTTGVTKGIVMATNVSLNVRFDAQRTALFEDQLVTTVMGRPGDSGSLGMSGNGKAFGLLFAGSDQATIYNDVNAIAKQLNVRFTP